MQRPVAYDCLTLWRLREPGALGTRSSILMQAKLATLGDLFGFSVWIPAQDRAAVVEVAPERCRAALLQSLPLCADPGTLTTVANIYVIWLRGGAIVRAFEVEHTTSIYSGLLRTADLLALQPNLRIALHIVAGAERRAKVRAQIVRPAFSMIEGGPLRSVCSFLAYEAIDEMLTHPQLKRMRDSLVEDYAEFFEV